MSNVPFCWRGVDKNTPRPPATAGAIAAWEEKNCPYRIPEDFKSFLLLSDGLLIRWSFALSRQRLPIGVMHINSLHKLNRIKTKKFYFYGVDENEQESSEDDEEANMVDDNKEEEKVRSV